MNTFQRMGLFAFIAVLLLVTGSLYAQGQQNATDAGARQFARNCAGCHGEDGRGGDKAPAIATMPSVVALSDDQLFKVVHSGTSEGMPAFPRLSDADITAVVRYLRVLQGKTASGSVETVTGNTNLGSVLFTGKGQCSNCHRVNGVGGFVGSDLTTYGQGHNQDAIIKAMVAPDGLVAPPAPIVEARTKSGQKISGAVRSEDNFNIELQSQDGRYYFLKRGSLADVAYTSNAHNLKVRLTDAEIRDIASFLIVTSTKSSASLTGQSVSKR